MSEHTFTLTTTVDALTVDDATKAEIDRFLVDSGWSHTPDETSASKKGIVHRWFHAADGLGRIILSEDSVLVKHNGKFHKVMALDTFEKFYNR